MLLEGKFDPCPKCSGHAIVDCIMQSFNGDENIDVRCMKCGLRMKYEYNAFEILPVRVTWSYDAERGLSVFDSWKSYGVMEDETN